MRWFVLILFLFVGGWGVINGVRSGITAFLLLRKSTRQPGDRLRIAAESLRVISAGVMLCLLGVLGFGALGDRLPWRGVSASGHERKQGRLTGETVNVSGTVAKVEPRQDGMRKTYVAVCRAQIPGGRIREFDSEPLYFDPGSDIVGRQVNISVDAKDGTKYQVHLDPLFVDLMVAR